MNKMRDKKEWVDEWISKGIEWCANTIWKDRQQKNELRKEVTELRKINRQLEYRNNEGFRILNDENNNLALILKRNGIKPVRLRLTYMTANEDLCGDCEDWECTGCPNYNKTVESEEFYFYAISTKTNWNELHDELEGITGRFRDRCIFDLLKVVDDRTGDIIWEKEVSKQ